MYFRKRVLDFMTRFSPHDQNAHAGRLTTKYTKYPGRQSRNQIRATTKYANDTKLGERAFVFFVSFVVSPPIEILSDDCDLGFGIFQAQCNSAGWKVMRVI